MELQQRSLTVLDWPVVLEALARHARTLRGASLARQTDLAVDAEQVRERYEAVAEVDTLLAEGEPLPIGAVSEIEPELRRAERGGVLDGGELRAVGSCLLALAHLRVFVEERAARLPRLHRLASPIEVDAELSGLLARSFDDEGRLSEREYPELGELRRNAEALEARIQRVLQDILGSEEMASSLQDRFVTQREGRFVIPVRAEKRKGLGIVHGRSQSGETVFVEPAAVVELHNERNLLLADLRRLEERILATLSRFVGRLSAPVLRSLDAAAELDLAVARAGLGASWRGVHPKVGGQGHIDLRAARHPVLVLRGLDVVANDLLLDAEHPGLVLSGPNAGGKTVALKTLGLCALLTRTGVPLPAAEGSRVDLFDPVVADIGDAQTVEGDLSTFSGHVAILAELLTLAARPRPWPALVLLDEVGMGTDPAQGAALARAVLESLVDCGARVAATTHFLQLKALAAVDRRFQVAAVAFEQGRPTWRVLYGAAGESHALEIARRMALPGPVLDRAQALLSSSERDLGELLGRLEEERASLSARREELDRLEAEALSRQQALGRREQALESRRLDLERRVSEGFQARMRKQEDHVKQLVAALQHDPDLRLAGRTLESVREAMRQARVPEPVQPTAPPPATLEVGQTVIVRALKQKGRVLRLLGADRVEVEVGRMRMKLSREELEGTRGEVFVAPPPPPPPPEPVRAPDGLRIAANTCDLRGLRVEEAFDRLDQFLASLQGAGFLRGFLLHGHGTGVLKTALRAELPRRKEIKKWRPAGVDEGGDAYTVVELRG